MTTLRDKAIRVIVSDYGGRGWGMAARCVDALLAAGMLTDPDAGAFAIDVNYLRDPNGYREALYQAWAVIANAYGREGGWHAANAEWREAAERWRDEQFHPLIGCAPATSPRDDEARIERALVAVWRVRLLPASALNGQSRSEAIARAVLAAADQEDAS